MKKQYNSGLVIGAFTMIGMGVGFLAGNMQSYMFIGIGVGFLLAYLFPVILKKDGDEIE